MGTAYRAYFVGSSPFAQVHSKCGSTPESCDGPTSFASSLLESILTFGGTRAFRSSLSPCHILHEQQITDKHFNPLPPAVRTAGVHEAHAANYWMSTSNTMAHILNAPGVWGWQIWQSQLESCLHSSEAYWSCVQSMQMTSLLAASILIWNSLTGC